LTVLHRYLGAAIVVLFVVIFLWGLVLLVLRRDEAPNSLWAVQHWTENLLVLQVVTGLVMLAMGRRVVGEPLVWLHYLYGSIFPLIAIVGGRIAGLRRERREYLGLAWGSFFALGLTLRALQTGCGSDPRVLARCLGFDA
jgi:hypothetical protein